MQCCRPPLDGVEAAEGVIPSALAATTTATGADLVEGCSDGRRGHVALLPTTATGVGYVGVSHIQPDGRPWTEVAALSPPPLKTFTGAYGSRDEARPFLP